MADDETPTPIWADHDDVLNLWIGPSKPSNTDQVDTLCLLAEAVIKGEFPTLPARALTDSDLALRAKLVVVQMVQGLYKNPQQMQYFQEQTGPFLRAGNFSPALLKLMVLSEEQRAMLVSSTKRRGGMVDMDPSPDLVFNDWDRW